MTSWLSRVLTSAALVSWSLGSNAALDVLSPRTIELNAFDAVKFASVADETAKTGVTLALFPQGAQAAVHISGGGPASRESPVIGPWAAPTPVNAVVLAGGSAFGLAAADGVMSCLEEHSIGFDTGLAKVPIVVQSDIYDLGYGSATRRPDAAMGRQACELALSGSTIKSGSYGAGSGATVGKLRGMKRAQKAGQGIAALQVGELKVAALVVVNALGDVIDDRNGIKLAGLMDERRLGFVDSREAFYARAPGVEAQKNNTTIGMVISNAALDRAQLGKLAELTTHAYARSIVPVGTLYDGDTVYAVSAGKLKADLNVVGTLAAQAMSAAIRAAVQSSQLSDEEFLSHCP